MAHADAQIVAGAEQTVHVGRSEATCEHLVFTGKVDDALAGAGRFHDAQQQARSALAHGAIVPEQAEFYLALLAPVLALNLLLIGPLAHVGVALSTAIAAWFNAVALGVLLWRRGHLLPDRRKAPVVIYVPGMDQTKEVFPKAFHNIALSRGFHVIAIDGPGQGNSNIQKIRSVGDNYERAGAAVISYLLKRKEVDKKKIAIYGISMGSYWCLRLSSYDHRAAAAVSSVACFNPNNTIFTQSSPRFKQMFMYMAGYQDEAKFDEEVAKPMTVRGQLGNIQCPTLLATGEFDPLSPLEDAIEAFGELKSQKEMWVFEDQFHQLRSPPNIGGLTSGEYVLDWLQLALGMYGHKLKKNHKRIAYIRNKGDGPWGDCEWVPPVRPGRRGPRRGRWDAADRRGLSRLVARQAGGLRQHLSARHPALPARRHTGRHLQRRRRRQRRTDAQPARGAGHTG